jgi:hypothetical protein
VYSDGDNKLVSLDGLQDVFNQYGFAVHRREIPGGAGLVARGSSVVLAARLHPFPQRCVDMIGRNYALTQADLLGPDVVMSQTRAQNAEWVTLPELRGRRNSLLSRTGPPVVAGSVVAAWAGKTPLALSRRIPPVTEAQITVGTSNSWRSRFPLEPPRLYGGALVGEVARDVVATLIRELYNREGDLHLTYVAPVIAGLPDPGAAWRAVITFILSQPALPTVTTVTDRILHPGDGEAGTTVLVVDLPADVRAALGLSDVPDGQDPPGIWRLAGLMRPVRPPLDLVGKVKQGLPGLSRVTWEQLVNSQVAREQVAEAEWAVMVRTRSGWYVRPGGAGGHQDEERGLAAAWSFPVVEDAIVVHVHTDPGTGLPAVGGELLTAEEFYGRVLAPRLPRPEGRGPEPGELLVMVACGLGEAWPGQAGATAQVLARLGNRPVLAASADVFTTAGGRVVTALLGFGGDGRPVVDSAWPAFWGLFKPGAAEPRVFGPVDLAAPEDLAAVLALVMLLPGPLVPAGGHRDPVSLAGAVRWGLGRRI